MFTPSQELEFNVAFIQQMLEDARLELDNWILMKEPVSAFQTAKSWTDADRKPSNVVTMIAWTEQWIELLINRLQQNKLKQKELYEEQFPSEWAVLRFHQAKILGKMNDIHLTKTRLACHDLHGKLLGFQQDFMSTNRELSPSKMKLDSSKKTKRKDGKVSIQT